MARIDRIKKSKKLTYLAYVFIFSLMLALNFLTPKCVDDYAYMISLATIEKIRGLKDIFQSLYVHAFTMNGRLVAHFFVYLFDWLPKALFNVVNAAMFTLLIFLARKIAVKKEETNFLTVVLIFTALWVFEPDFGQVNLWLTGSCNYLWGLVFCLLYIYVFYDLYMYGTRIRKGTLSVVFILLSFFAGAYNEVASFAAILIGFVFLVLTWIQRKTESFLPYLLALITCAAGFFSMFLAPAEAGKSGDLMSFRSLLDGFLAAGKMYLNFWPLLVLWGSLFFVSFPKKKTDKRMISSLVFFAGSLCANFVLSAASSYPGRCAGMALMLLIIADGILLDDLTVPSASAISFGISAAALLAFGITAVFGVYDVYNTGRRMRSNEKVITDGILAGEDTISIQCVYARTKYSAIYQLKYIDLERSDIWPNENMATYFGVDSISGLE